jgi:ribosomal protein S18 acetylase RimI-like enzyme
MTNITYTFGNQTLLGRIKPLWRELNKHHLSRSPYFKEYYQNLTFEERKRVMLQRLVGGGHIRVDLAFDSDALVGYCVSSIDRVLTGEIDSICVDEAYRGRGIGTTLVKNVLVWLASKGSKKNIVSVAVGNEQAYGFYAKFGFLPRRTMLEQKKQ